MNIEVALIRKELIENIHRLLFHIENIDKLNTFKILSNMVPEWKNNYWESKLGIVIQKSYLK